VFSDFFTEPFKVCESFKHTQQFYVKLNRRSKHGPTFSVEASRLWMEKTGLEMNTRFEMIKWKLRSLLLWKGNREESNHHSSLFSLRFF